MARQEDLKQIYEGAVRDTPVGGVAPNLMCRMNVIKADENNSPVIAETAILRRGYKIQHTVKTGMYELFLTTTTDYYKYVDDTIIDEFLEKGFVRAVDEHQVKRDKRQVKSLNKKIESATNVRNDSLMVHWRNKRRDLIEKISLIEESLAS